MLLLELLQPATRQAVEDVLLVPARMGKQPGLLHDLFVADLEPSLLLSPDVVAERAVKVGVLPLSALDGWVFWLLIPLEILILVPQNLGNRAVMKCVRPLFSLLLFRG